ncbi:MAG: response regulator transcription factor [Acidobacteriota bacterium]|nr:response regulator transcription factor [Acidobacteriota bacterium]
MEIQIEDSGAPAEITLNIPQNSHFAAVPTPPDESYAVPKRGVFVVAENRLLRDLLCELIAAQPAFTLLGIGAAADSHFTVKMAEAGDAMGLFFLSKLSTSEQFVAQIEPLRSNCPRLRIVLIGMPQDPSVFLTAVASGVVGYVQEDASTEEVLAAVEAVARGEVACPRQLLPALFRSIASRNAIIHGPMDSNPFGLSRRECELLPLVARGWTNKQIAAELHVCEQTVKNHLRRMLRKAGAANRMAMVERCRHAATRAAAAGL